MKHINESPIENGKLKPFISCIDHTVSNETFSISIDEASELLITTPRPLDKDLGAYYDSDRYISHSNAKKLVLDKVYQRVRNYTTKRKVKLINSFNTKDRTILDIGTGTGDFLSACKEAGWEISGIEPNLKANEAAKNKTAVKIVEDISELKLEQFDVITMWHVLEHVPNLTEYISRIKQLLKPDGILVVGVPNYKSYDAVYYDKYWAAYDVPRHLWHFSQKSIHKLFHKENMKIDKIVPMLFDAFYVSLLSEKYKAGSTNFLKAFYIGLKSNFKARGTKDYSSLMYIIKND